MAGGGAGGAGGGEGSSGAAGGGGAPVVWAGETDTEHCAGCSSAFTFTLRRHSCRMCGASFCTRCSSAKRPVPWRGHAEPVRVCDMCVQALDRQRQRNRLQEQLDGASRGGGGAVPAGSGTRSAFNNPADVRRREQNSVFMEALKRIYNAKIRPLEQAFRFSDFYNSELSEGDFDARPMVLLVGQYSVGKTTFIRYLLERDFPNQRIGPEPTTDRFVAVMHGANDRVVPGNAAAVDAQRPFTSLTKFGTAFLNRFELVELSSPILEALAMVDTPGILSGEKQRLERGYSFEQVVQWFAERADRVLVLFDAHKLDISDELKRTIEVLKPHEEKIRVVLNKADLIDTQQLMRVYGALMWSLGKVVRSPEVLRVYIGSFWDRPLGPNAATMISLFDAERIDLIGDLRALPRNAAIRKVNELVKRARLVKVHALLVTHLRANMPYLWGHEKKFKKLVGRLESEYAKVAKLHDLAAGDFPPIEKFRSGLERFELHEFPALNQRLVDIMDVALSKDVPNLIFRMQALETQEGGGGSGAAAGGAARANGTASRSAAPAAGAASSPKMPSPSPGDDRSFGDDADEFFETSWNDGGGGPAASSPSAAADDDDDAETAHNPFAPETPASAGEAWVIDAHEKTKWDNLFFELGASGQPAVVPGSKVRPVMVQSGLATTALRQIWELCDFGARGALDAEEFALCMHLVAMARIQGLASVPQKLPESFVPPSRR